ncbi:hypothetical protein [Rossellomorea sp. BNER]|uniref:hypothetical protein n=1 Tax=Rossellomorea sp. BNER TaxID=2962031 RepID=UPI003AF28E32|nr:hypothetical protein [Rossellomorea sp. BNER]
MKVKIKENIVGLDFSYTIGEEVNVKKELGNDLINAGYADEIKLIKKNTKKSGDK